MRLEVLTRDNYEAAFGLEVRADQRDLVAPVVKSVAEAYIFGEQAWPRLVYDGERLVGFVMAFLDIEYGPGDVRSGLWRLAIAAGEQGRGYGRFAVGAVCEELRSRGATRAYVSWEPRDGGPEPFYLGLGFKPTGEDLEGQKVGVLEL